MIEQRVYENALNGLKNADVKIDDEIRNPAIKAIKKQIPRKVEVNYNSFPCDWRCPNGCTNYDGYQTEYCPKCGQRLKWR